MIKLPTREPINNWNVERALVAIRRLERRRAEEMWRYLLSMVVLLSVPSFYSTLNYPSAVTASYFLLQIMSVSTFSGPNERIYTDKRSPRTLRTNKWSKWQKNVCTFFISIGFQSLIEFMWVKEIRWMNGMADRKRRRNEAS